MQNLDGQRTTQRAALRSRIRSRVGRMGRAGLPRPALRELLLVASLYVAYTASRSLASNDFGPAVVRATRISHFEGLLDISWEHTFNRVFAAHTALGLFADYWYSTAHYVGTLAVLVWLYRRGRDVYLRARRALATATLTALVLFLLLPTAPPRMLGGYVDVLAEHARDGWWGSDASAPRGLGGLTNQLAAFPSLHAGWSLWVALAVTAATYNRVARALGWAYAATTALVVIGTANHWVVDVLVGWLIVSLSWLAADQVTRLSARRRARSAEAWPTLRARAGESRSAVPTLRPAQPALEAEASADRSAVPGYEPWVR